MNDVITRFTPLPALEVVAWVRMTPRQARFVEEYLVDLNATQAAIRAGYSARSAHTQGDRQLRDGEIRQKVEARGAAHLAAVGVTAENIGRRAWEIAQGTDLRAAVAALNLLAKRHPEFSAKHEISGPEGGPLLVLGELRHVPAEPLIVEASRR